MAWSEMEVVEQFQDRSDPDGFPNIFVMEDGSLVFTSEKRGKHIRIENVHGCARLKLLGSSYKCGFDNLELQRALDEIPAGVECKNFDPVQRMLYLLVMEVSIRVPFIF